MEQRKAEVQAEGAFTTIGAQRASQDIICQLVCSLGYCLSKLLIINSEAETVSWLRNPFDILAMTHGATSCPQSSQCHIVVFLACRT